MAQILENEQLVRKLVTISVTYRDWQAKARVCAVGTLIALDDGMTNSPVRVNLQRLLAWAPYSRRYFAVRSDVAGIASGTVLRPSRVWDDGSPTSETLSGTCATTLDEALADASYLTPGKGRQVYLVTGECCLDDPCEDPGEVILRDCTVVCQLAR